MDELGSFERHGDIVDLRFERRYARPAETVWAALTDPARLANWIGPARVEPCLGGRYELFIDRQRPMTGRILTWEPPSVLEFSWDTGDAPASVVRCELTREGDGTLLVFRHNGVGFDWVALVLPGWHSLFEQMENLLSGRETQLNSMPRWRALQAIYVDKYGLENAILDPPPGHGE
jgi:uncharacterized protein YndB with AHSA1/START domain